KKIWVARASAHEIKILPVDYCNMVVRGQTATNYQIYPGDRIYVGSDPRILIDSNLAKTLNPIERVFGAVLLGSGTVNSIQGRFGWGGGVPKKCQGRGPCPKQGPRGAARSLTAVRGRLR